MAFNIRGVIALDGEAELRKAVTNINSSLREMKSELANTEAEFKGQANTMEALQAKYSTLSSAVEQAKEKEKALSEIVTTAKKKQDDAANSLDKANKEYEEAKKKLDEMKASSSSTTSELSAQEKEVGDLSSKLSSAKKNYLDAETSTNKWNTSLNNAQTETKQLETELNKTGKYLDEAKNSTNGCATSIDNYGKEITDAGKDTENFGSIVKANLTSDALEKGLKLLGELGEKAVEAAKEVVEVGSEFEASMSNVAAISGVTGSNLDSLTAKAKQMGQTTKYTASEAADAFSYMALAGWDTEEMLSGIDGVLNLAAAADMDLAEASDIVTDYLTAFGLTAEDSAEFVDMMAYAMANSNTTVEDLGEAYKNCAATASSLGYSAEEVTAVLATMANAGVKGGEAGTALNTIMTRLATNTKDCGDALAEYGVDIYDSEGNMNSLSDILEGMSGIWADLSDQEQASLAKTIAGTSQYSSLQTIMSGLSDEAKASGKSFSDYAEALEDCSGTAEEMADTMQDNLSGDMTKMNSALQGLAIEAYDYVDGPLRSAVQGVTDVINGVTEAITPQQSNLESLVSSAKEAKNNIDSVLSSAQSTVSDAETDAAEIELLGQQLLSLNNTEDLSLTQKERLKEIVDELGESIPELADAYNEETGKVDLNNEAIQNLITSSKELMVTNAMQTAMEDEMTALAEATVALEKAKIAQESLVEERDVWQELSDSMMVLYNDSGDLSGAQELVTQAFKDGKISTEAYNEAMDLLASNDVDYAISGVNDKITEYNGNISEAEKTTEGLSDSVDEAQESYDTLTEACERLTEEQEESTETTKNYALATDQSTESLDGTILSMDNAVSVMGDFTAEAKAAAKSSENLGDAEEDAADSTEDLESALDDATEAAEKAAEAQESAFNTIYDAYTSTMESIQSDLVNKIDLSSKFDGGEDITTETMNENLASYVEGLQTYQENLEKVRQMTNSSGEKIFSDEVLAQIEANGTDMADMLEHIVWTYENQGEYGVEQIESINDQWQEAMDISEEIASAGAANQTAYELAMGELGSSDIDFSNLRDAIDEAVESAGEGWSGLTDETKAALDEAVQTAQELGIQIPESLTDNIADGVTSAEQATEQLNASIQGTLEGLLQVAQESGASVAPELASAIEDGTADAASAMQTLMDAITDGTSDSGVGTAVESAVDEGTEAIESAAGDYSAGGETLSSSIAEGITENAEEISTAAEDAALAGAEAAQSDANVEAYKNAGEALAEAVGTGLTENTGEVSDKGTELGEAIAKAVSEALNGTQALSQYTDAGSKAALAYAEAMGAEDSTAATEAQKLAAAALDALTETTQFEAAGNDAAFAYNTPFGSDAMGTDASSQAAKLVKAATDELNSHITSFEAYGNESSSAYAVAISSQSDTARSKAKSMAAQALAGAKYNQASFKTAGSNMSAGVAAGITAGQSGVITAAKTMAAAALNAAEAELEIQSPSKKFKNAVGKQISAGTAFGISDNASLAGDAAEKMSSEVYSKATAWLTKYKKSHSVSLADEEYYWEQVAKHCEEGTTAYNNAIAKMIKASVSTKDSSGNKKDTETYYSDIYDAADDYMDKLQILEDVSLTDQINYWKAIQKQLKSGTDAWYDAQEKINDLTDSYYDTMYDAAADYASKMDIMDAWSLKEQLAYWEAVQEQLEEGTDAWYNAQSKIKSIKSNIGTVSNMSSLLSAYKTYYDMSAKAEMEYWDVVRQQYEEGTDERLEADQKYFDAKEDYYEKLEDLEEDYADSVKDIEEKLADDIADLTDSYNDSLQSRIDTIADAYSLFDEFTSESEDGKTLLFNLQSQAAGYEAWSDALDALEARGILSDELLEELTDMGPDQLAAIYALSDLTDDELTAYQEAYDRKMDAAAKQAEEDTADLKAEMEAQTAELTAQAEQDKADLLAEYQQDVESVNTTISTELLTLANNTKSIAEDQTTALVNAISGGVTEIKSVLETDTSTASDTGTSTALESVGATTSSSSGTTSSSTSSSSSASTTTSSTTTSTSSSKSSSSSSSSGDGVPKAGEKVTFSSGKYYATSYGTGSTGTKNLGKSVYIQRVLSSPKSGQNYPILIGTSKSSGQLGWVKKSQLKGYRTGGRNIQDELVWMDEELKTKGSELIISKADNAILTRINPGDDIIDADTTSNLMRLAQIDPDDLLAALSKQQEVALDCLEEINAAGTAAQVNNLASMGNAGMNYVDLTGLNEKMEAIASVMSEYLPYLPYLEEGQKIVLDSGELVGGIENKMSKRLAAMARRG